MDNRAIGVFDSGLGGLTAVRQLHRVMPNEDIIYFGDTGRVPYGSRGRQTIINYTRQDTAFLTKHDIKAIVVACGTVSSVALDVVKGEHTLPMVGVVKPACHAALKCTKNDRVGIIGTRGTIQSGSYEARLHTQRPGIETIARACPLFVPLVENGRFSPDDKVVQLIVEEYLSDIKDFGVDTLILGCTHFPLLRSTIRSVMGPGVNLVNPAYETAVELRRILEWKDLLRGEDKELKTGEYKYEFYVSDTPGRLQTFASSILPYEVEHIEKIKIEEY